MTPSTHIPPFWRPSFGTAERLTRLIGNLVQRQDPRGAERHAQVKVAAMRAARKAVLAHEQEELRARIRGARAAHKPTAALQARLERVTTEILSIGE